MREPAGDLRVGAAEAVPEFLAEVRFPVLPRGTGTGYAEDRRVTVYPQAAAMAVVLMCWCMRIPR